MKKLTFACALAVVGLISIATLSLRAASPGENQVIRFKGKKVNWAWATTRSEVVRRVDPNPEHRAVIFSNLGPMGHLYEDTVASEVSGPDTTRQQQWLAMPFTANFDAEVTRIAVGIEHGSGPNSFVLSLNADGGGLAPGNPLHTWHVNDAPSFGTCCILDVVKDGDGIRVRKGKQYWVVATTNEDERTTLMDWDLSPFGIEGNFAVNNGQGWMEDTEFTSAFAVFGKKVR